MKRFIILFFTTLFICSAEEVLPKKEWPIFYKEYYNQLKSELSADEFKQFSDSKTGWLAFLAFDELKDPFDYQFVAKNSDMDDAISLVEVNSKYDQQSELKKDRYRVAVAVIAQNYSNNDLKHFSLDFIITEEDKNKSYVFHDKESYFRFGLNEFDAKSNEIKYNYDLINVVDIGKDKVFYGHGDSTPKHKLRNSSNCSVTTQVMQILKITDEKLLSQINKSLVKVSYVMVKVSKYDATKVNSRKKFVW